MLAHFRRADKASSYTFYSELLSTYLFPLFISQLLILSVDKCNAQVHASTSWTPFSLGQSQHILGPRIFDGPTA